ncbi:MAG: hypothetical protein ACYC1F_08225 [Gallionellaceae bacterium]
MRLKSHGHLMITMMPRKSILQCIGLGWIAIFFFMTTSVVAAEEIRQRKVVDDVEIVLAVPHAEREPEPRIESQYEHHLVIWLFERGTSKSIEGAQVKAKVAQAGYAGSEKILKPMMTDEKPAYSGFFMMPGRFEYRITVQIRRPGESRVIEAQFEYRHHHKLR